jgi:hypothetical protein
MAMGKEYTMKYLSLLLILGLAAGCDAWTNQPYTQGCAPTPNSSVLTSVDDPVGSVIDLDENSPTFGQCIGRASGGGTGTGGTGTGGTGGAGGGGDIFPPLDGETNLATCGSTADPANDNCDYGCTALGNTFGFVAVLSVAPDESLAGGSSTATEFTGFFVVSEAFIEGAEGVLGVDLLEARVPAGATLPLTALEGATGPDLTLTLEEVTIDLTEDPDNNGTKGPFFLPFVPAADTYTYGDSGSEACFNLAAVINFVFEVTSPFTLPASFACEPCDQELINQDNVSCADDSACLAPSTCDTAVGECTSVIAADVEAGQVCFTIP